ncbi:hypothetical protein J6590_094871 [Homalodisca vitripennis]|nr:hypothetical protein J6590_094871 [Homalodisca vitripennis]
MSTKMGPEAEITFESNSTERQLSNTYHLKLELDKSIGSLRASNIFTRDVVMGF